MSSDQPGFQVIEGDCIEQMAAMPDASVHAIVTDPPYGIGFMGREWDVFKPEVVAKRKAERERKGTSRTSKNYPDRIGKTQGGGPSVSYDESLSGNQRFQAWMTNWALECIRVLKPGGHLLAFGGPRTYHRLASAIEDAGFDIRDSLLWLFGMGFPKGGTFDDDLEGWGTNLKPAHEPIVVARKPLAENNVPDNMRAHGTGAINIDGCRVGFASAADRASAKPGGRTTSKEGGDASKPDAGRGLEREDFTPSDNGAGRWPANVVLSHTPLCEEVGIQRIKGDPRETGDGERPGGFADVGAESGDPEPNAPVYGDELVIEWDCAPGCPVAALDAQSGIGGASRFFYTAKTSKTERNAGLAGFEEKIAGGMSGRADGSLDGTVVTNRNHHPTVKPINLMRWLVRMVTPPGGTVLDPFNGSGSTGCAAVLEGVDFIGIEREAEYVQIAEARIAWWQQHRGREAEEVLALSMRSERKAAEQEAAGQLGLLG